MRSKKNKKGLIPDVKNYAMVHEELINGATMKI
jgi:hypothetical protein